MLTNEKIAIAAHLHVLLRRKTGRVTDTEWMVSNREYALEIVRFAREKAAEDGHTDLAILADRLADIMVLTAAQQASAPPPAPQVKASAESGFSLFTLARSLGDSESLQAPRYVAGLR
jgi:hypothetical protein